MLREGDLDFERIKNAYIVKAHTNGVNRSDIKNDKSFYIFDGKLLTGTIEDELADIILSTSDRLCQFILGGARISEKSITDICRDVLPKLQFMRVLDLSYIVIPYEAQTVLYRMVDPGLSGYCPILNLNLSRTGLGYNGCRRIFEGLAGNISLKELYICGNRCTDKAIPALVAMLKNPDSALEALGISNNSITVEGIKLLAPALGSHGLITELKLSGNPFGSDGAALLFSKLWQGRLKVISMNRCGIVSCDWSSTMIYMTSLESVYLAQNSINPTSFQVLCENLHRCACIRHLDVSFNALNGLNSGCVGQLMKVHKGIISINMSGNKFPNEVISAIILGIYANCTLRVLDLSSCELSTDNATALCAALAKSSLLQLRLSNNPIPDDMRSNPRTSTVFRSQRAAVELTKCEIENDGKGRLVPENLIAAVLTSSDIVSGSGAVVADHEEHLEFAFIDALSAETASAIWRRRRIDNINKSKRAFEIFNGLRSEDDAKAVTPTKRRSSGGPDVDEVKEKELQLHLDPSAAAEREKQQAQSSQTQSFDIIDGKCILSVSYGRRTEVLGTIEVLETMTYFETRELILPLLQNYFRSSDPKQIENAKHFKMLDGMGAVLNDEAERVRVAWAELSTCGYCVHIQPADWLYIPK